MNAKKFVCEHVRRAAMFYILGSISEGKNEEQFVERLDGDRKLVKIWVETLQQIGFITKNSFNEIVVTPDGENYLKKFG